MEKALINRPLETFTKPDPTNAQKPILAGNYLNNNQLHTILYYVDKNNPTGPQPANPNDDSQFRNWEAALLAWGAKNIPNFGNYNQPGSLPAMNQPNGTAMAVTVSSDPPQVIILKPSAGEFLSSAIPLSVNIKAPQNLLKIAVLWNGARVHEFTGLFGTTYSLNWSFTPVSANSQNLLEVEATTQGGVTGRSSVIVYR
jgi:hypothetical protein